MLAVVAVKASSFWRSIERPLGSFSTRPSSELLTRAQGRQQPTPTPVPHGCDE